MKPYVKIEHGNKFYYKDKGLTILHRLHGPAIEDADGHKEWWVNGKRHRVDGPAIEWANGAKEWFLNGKLHRVDGPAAEHTDGFKSWWLNGKLHRADGPAIEDANGHKEWWLKGKKFTEEEFNTITKPKTDKDATIAALKEQLAAALKENEQLRK